MKIIEERKKERISAIEELKHLQALVDEMRNIGKVAQDLGFSESEYALYRILADNKSEPEKEPLMVRESPVQYGKDKDDYKGLTLAIMESLAKLAVIDWIHKEDVQREMRKQIKGILRAEGYQFDEMEVLTAKIMDLARVRLTK
jgi:type I restriction enzyme R subunit